MAYLFRLIAAVVLLLAGSSSFALIPKVSGYTYQANIGCSSPSGPTGLTSAQAACDAAAAGYNAWNSSWKISNQTASGTVCSGTAVSVSNPANTVTCSGSISPTGAMVCPSGSTASGTSCACNDPLIEDSTHTSCIVPPVPPPGDLETCAAKAGTSAGQYTAPYVVADGVSSPLYTNLCDSCLIKVRYDIGVGDRRYGEGIYAGTACVPSLAGDGSSSTAAASSIPGANGEHPNAAPSPCAKGEFSGTVNGVQRCIKSIGNDVVLAPKVVTGDVPIAGAPADSVTSSTVTACSGAGSCTTTTTYSNSSGVKTGETTKTENRDTFCKDNPNSVACAGSSSQGSFAGACGSPPACSGDAVMCAIAAATFATNCTISNPDLGTGSPENTAYEAAKLVTGDQTTQLPGNTSLTLTP